MNSDKAFGIFMVASLLYGIELLVLAFVFQWFYLLAAVAVFFSFYLIFTKFKDITGSVICIIVSIFTFVTLRAASSSLLLSLVLAFILPTGMIICLFLAKKKSPQESLPATCPNSEYLDHDYWCDLGDRRVRISQLAFSYQDIAADHAQRVCNGNYTGCPLYLAGRFSGSGLRL